MRRLRSTIGRAAAPRRDGLVTGRKSGPALVSSLKSPALQPTLFKRGTASQCKPDPPTSAQVYDDQGVPMQLGDEIGSGGEGRVYEVNQRVVCKIYKQSEMNDDLIRKLRLMISTSVNLESICWPLSLAFDHTGTAIGYLMPKASGIEIQNSIFIPKPVLQQRRPHWTRFHLLRLTSHILNTIKYLHDHEILVGDLNARNILISDDQKVFFVDCDSYQIGEFPCRLGTPLFLAPELQGIKFDSMLRTKLHEYFSVAAMVFMVLHPGKPPYSHRGGQSPRINVRRRHFPYSRGDQRANGVPLGPWRYVWSHLPRYMKDAFHQVFSDGERPTVAGLARPHSTLSE